MNSRISSVIALVVVVLVMGGYIYWQQVRIEKQYHENKAQTDKIDSIRVQLEREGKVSQDLFLESQAQGIEIDKLTGVLNGVLENIEQINGLEAQAKSLILKSQKEYQNNLIAEKDFETIETEINSFMSVMYNSLNLSRERVEELESMLELVEDENSQLQTLLLNLRKVVTSQSATIERLREEKTELLSTLQVVQQENENLKKAFVLVGTIDQLKDSDVIEKKFLKPTKVKAFDASKFEEISVEETRIFLGDYNFKDINILTDQKKNTEFFDVSDDGKYLIITEPRQFWRISKYLIVEIDY
jgi:hypothetical protein